jgi:hypothetical protein
MRRIKKGPHGPGDFCRTVKGQVKALVATGEIGLTWIEMDWFIRILGQLVLAALFENTKVGHGEMVFRRLRLNADGFR